MINDKRKQMKNLMFIKKKTIKNLKKKDVRLIKKKKQQKLV